MTQYLHGVHDVDGANLMAEKPGWLVVTTAIGCDPHDMSGINFLEWTNRGYGLIVRLNNGYAPAGTIPVPDKYGDFAQRCGNFVAASPGVNLVIIGNEPNHSNEWPNGQKIDPAGYAHCYAVCKQAIHAVKRDCKVLVAGCAPWDNEAGMDWLDYWKIVINNVYPCDGFAIHAGTHGADPGLIFSDQKVNNWYWHFRTYRDQLAALPAAARLLPVYITEAAQGDDAWADANSGWVQNAYAEIDAWNKSNTPTIHALCLYCTHKRDRWYIMDKAGVQADFRAAVAKGYQSPQVMGATSMPQTTFIPSVSTGTSTPALPPRQVDPAAALRGVTIKTPNVAPGKKFWFAKNIQWLNEKESQGRHHILGNVYKDGVNTAGVPLYVKWPSGDDDIKTEDKSKDPPPFNYWYNYPMGPSLNEFSIRVNDGAPSEIVKGIGMGADGNSHVHTSTVVEWELVTMPQAQQPAPTKPDTMYVNAPNGLFLRHDPTADSLPITAAVYGDPVEILGFADGGRWANVSYKGQTGWMAYIYLTDKQPASVPQTPEQPPAPAPPTGDNWSRILTFLHQWEGGFQDVDWDAGNWTGCEVGKGIKKGTNFGISACGYPNLDIENLSQEQADDIFRRDMYLALGIDKQPWPLSLLMMNAAVNFPKSNATAWLAQSGGDPLLFYALMLRGYRRSAAWPQAGNAWVDRMIDLALKVKGA